MDKKETLSFSGKIAVATDDHERVTGHLGRCGAFMIYEISEGKTINKEIRENLFTNHRRGEHNQHNHEEGGHSHVHLIEGLKDCGYLISHGGGWRVVEDLKQNNIAAIFTDVELIEDAVNLFIKGELANNEELTCRHHK